MSFEGYANYNMSHVQPLQPRKQRTPAPSGQPGQHEYRRSDVLESTASAVRPGSSRTGSYNTPEGYDTRAVPSQQSTRLAQAVSDRQRPSSQLSFASVSDLDDEDSRGLPQMHQDVYVEEEPISSAPVAKTPKAMNTVMAAFSDAGRRFNQQQNQVPAKAKTRKTAFGEQGESARMKRLQQEFPATPAFRAIERVLAQIAQNWPMLLPQDLPDEGPFGNDADDHFNPVPLALALLDPASIDQSASQLNHFLQLKEDLGDALKSHIQLHYRAFDASVSAYNGVVANLRAAQKQVSGLRSNIGNVTKVLGSRREELAGMVSRRDELSEMCRILDTIDQLKDTPDRLESLLSEKRFLAAVVLLSKSLKTINKGELLDISALGDLRAYLQSQEGAVYDILVEELHNHLYLKSFYCEGRWKPYTRGQSQLPVAELTDDDLAASQRPGYDRGRPKLDFFLEQLAEKPSVDPLLSSAPELTANTDPLPDDMRPPSPNPSLAPPSPTLSAPREPLGSSTNQSQQNQERTNPELDSFAYIESLFESLAVLGKLPDALDAVAHRIPVEVFSLVDATVDEVDDRNIDSKKRMSTMPSSLISMLPDASAVSASIKNASADALATLAASNPRSALLRLNATQATALELSAETLRDLFWTLYSKLDAVLQGFRVGYEVCLRISERRSFSATAQAQSAMNGSTSVILSLVEIWKPIQAEVRLMLHEYLTEDEEGTGSSRNPVASLNDVLRGTKSARDTSKTLFKFSDSDVKTSKLLKSHEEELSKSLRASVPGLVSAVGEGTAALSAVVASDNTDTSAAQHRGIHRLLTTPDPFNVSILFGPTLSFVDRMKQVLPGNLAGDDERGFSAFLDDFVANTYLPMLEDKVTSLYLQAVSGADAFAEDTSFRRNEQTPLVKCALNIFMLISSLCGMLWGTPFHRESYSRLIISVIEQFLTKCNERFNDLVAKDSNEYSPNSPTLRRSQSHHAASATKRAASWARDPNLFKVLQRLLSSSPSDDPNAPSEDLIQELKMNLDMKASSPIAEEDLITSPKKLSALSTLHESLRWFITHLRTLRQGNQGVPIDAPNSTTPLTNLGTNQARPLPLTTDMANRFDSLIKQFCTLSDVSIFTLRCELRLRVLYSLENMSLPGLYILSEIPSDPDGFVADLNGQLTECDECFAATLDCQERNHVLVGLPTLIDQVLIMNARRVNGANGCGGEKLYRNVLALQQNLKNLGEVALHATLDRSKQFYMVLRDGDARAFGEMVKHERDWPFSPNESHTLLGLLCGVDQEGQAVKGVGHDVELYKTLLPAIPHEV